jgi:hypothetical protein
MSETFCICLPSGNRFEFDSIEAQFLKRGIAYVKKDLSSGGAIFEFDESQIDKLPSDNLGHFIPVNDISGYTFYKLNSDEDCLYKALSQFETGMN